MAWYVYGVTRPVPDRTPFESPPGVADAPVTLLGTTALEAIVSPAVPEMATSSTSEVVEAARRHDRVLVEAAATRDVLPVRFGTVLPDGNAVEAWLADPDGRLRRALDAVAGAEEWVLTVAPAPDEGVPDVEETSPGHAFFARRRALADHRTSARDRASRVAEDLDRDLRSLCRRATSLPLQHGEAVARGAYLVPRGARDAVLARIEQVEGAVVEASGPLPAYRFAHEEAS